MSPIPAGMEGIIDTDTFGSLTDIMAAQITALASAMGAEDEPGTASFGSRINILRIKSLDDPRQMEALLRYFIHGASKKTTDPNAHVLFEGEIKGLSFHVSGVNNYCALNNFRVAPEFAEIHARVTGVKLEPKNVFPPAIPVMAEFEVTAPDAGVFTHHAAIDADKYGPAHLKVMTFSEIGASDITATIQLVTFEGAPAEKEVVIPAGTPAMHRFDIGSTDDRYADVAGITITGGTAGESFCIEAPRERALPTI